MTEVVNKLEERKSKNNWYERLDGTVVSSPPLELDDLGSIPVLSTGFEPVMI